MIFFVNTIVPEEIIFLFQSFLSVLKKYFNCHNLSSFFIILVVLIFANGQISCMFLLSWLSCEIKTKVINQCLTILIILV